MDDVAPDVHQSRKLRRIVLDQHSYRKSAYRTQRQRKNVAGELLGYARRYQCIKPGGLDGESRLARELMGVVPEAARTLIAHRDGKFDEEVVAQEKVLRILDYFLDGIAAGSSQLGPARTLGERDFVDVGQDRHDKRMLARKVVQQGTAGNAGQACNLDGAQTAESLLPNKFRGGVQQLLACGLAPLRLSPAWRKFEFGRGVTARPQLLPRGGGLKCTGVATPGLPWFFRIRHRRFLQ